MFSTIRNNSASYLTGQVLPDRSFSVGIVPKRKTPEIEEVEASIEKKIYPRRGLSMLNSCLLTFGAKKRGEQEGTISWFTSPPKLSQSTLKGRYGQKGISNKASRRVRASASALERKYGRKRLSLVTCTCPNFSSENLRAIARHWTEVCRVFFQRLRRLKEKKKAPLAFISVSEVQEGRFARYGDVALHLHFVHVCRPRPSGRDWYVDTRAMRRIWNQTLRRICAKYGEGIDEKAKYGGSVDDHVVRTSASNYVGKYISKGCKTTQKIIDAGRADLLPSQWWNNSREMKELFEVQVSPLGKDRCVEYFYYGESYLEMGELTYYTLISADIGGEERIIGCYGILTEAAYEKFLLESERPYLPLSA